ncbi:MAG TPA: hypothetical protein ENI62_11225 [Gammaproteobacteria bacterium]|nr:hypothetical protein [Gammaproteobacteria bacterium]
MYMLIQQARARLPFSDSMASVCHDQCRGCSRKLLEYIDSELNDWQQRLNAGQKPNFGQLHGLARKCHKIHSTLQHNDLYGDGQPPKL